MSKKHGYCTYCGQHDKLSRDHVIPKCLFNGNLPGDIPKVPACDDCNTKVKSANDRYLRDLLVVDMDSSQHPIAQQLFAKFARSVQRKQSELAFDLMQSQQLVELFTQAGVFAEWGYTSRQANQRSTPILTMMVRGLYRAYVKQVLPQDTTFETFRIRDMEKFRVDVQMLYQMGGRYVHVGDGEVFKCAYGYAQDRPGVSLWFLCFYTRVCFGVITDRLIRIAESAS